MQNTPETKDVCSRITNEWLTSSEAAQYVKIKRRTLLQWVRQGKAKAYQLSGTFRHVWRFRQSDLDAMLSPSSAGSADKGAE